jgi:hypothetical protein
LKKIAIVLAGALCSMLAISPAQAETKKPSLAKAAAAAVTARSVNDSFDLTATGLRLGSYDCGDAHSRTTFYALPTEGYLDVEGATYYYDTMEFTVDYTVYGPNGVQESSDFLWTDGGLSGKYIDYTSDYFFCGGPYGTLRVVAEMNATYWVDLDHDGFAESMFDTAAVGGLDSATAYFQITKPTAPPAPPAPAQKAWAAVAKAGQPKKSPNRSWKVTGKLARSGDSTYGGQFIKLQKKVGARWVAAKMCRTKVTGKCTVKVRTTKTGTYRFAFTANATTNGDVSPAFRLRRR